MKTQKSTPSMATRLRTRICNPFMGALVIIGLSTLPYFHDFITDPEGVKPWVPTLGIQDLLTDSNNKILGFSAYRVFLYTFLIFVFASIGWTGWYRSVKHKYYGSAVFLVMSSGIYQVLLIIFNLRRTVFNELQPKSTVLLISFLILGYVAYRKHGISFKKMVVWILFLVLATFPYLHDVITERNGSVRAMFPNFGLESFLTDSNGMVRGLRSYRLLLYLFGIYAFSHIGWIGWFMDCRGKKYRAFLLVPAALSFYQVVLIIMSFRDTEFNSPSINLYITLTVSILVAVNFFFNNRVYGKAEEFSKNTNFKTSEHENR